jgi:hypothetical protein
LLVEIWALVLSAAILDLFRCLTVASTFFLISKLSFVIVGFVVLEDSFIVLFFA